MDKKFCDRCGKEVQNKTITFCRKTGFKEVWLHSEFAQWGEVRKKYELCYDCMCALKKFMNDPNKYHLPKVEEEDQHD